MCIILFSQILAVLDLHRCAGFSLVVESRGYSPVVVCGLFIAMTSLCCRQNTSSRVHRLQWLWHMGLAVVVPEFQRTGSIVVVHPLSCSVVCGIFLGQGSNPCLLHWQADSLPRRHQGCPRIFFKYKLQNYSFHIFFLKFFFYSYSFIDNARCHPLCVWCVFVYLQFRYKFIYKFYKKYYFLVFHFHDIDLKLFILSF